jgi:ABC-2 type transport system ATP-binding protein
LAHPTSWSEAFTRKTVVHLANVTEKIANSRQKLNAVKNMRAVENKLVLDMDHPETDNPELVRTIVAAGGDIQYVTELKSTLEDVYLKLIREAKAQ